jgi:predicted DNA-binding transcriptional regulator AlpA
MHDTVDPFLRREQVLEVAGCSNPTLKRWCKRGIFPKPYKIGPHSVGWRLSEVKAWSNSRPHADGAETPPNT